MRNLWFATIAAAVVVLPSSAFAAVYNFSSTETSAIGNPTYTFAIDTATGVESGGATSFSGVTIAVNGAKSTGNTISFPSPTELGSSLFFFIDTDVPGPKSFGMGSGASVTFDPGTFSIADGFTEGEGTLTISEAAVSAAPEPSAWLLMITGVAGVGLMLRQAKRKLGCRLKDAFAA